MVTFDTVPANAVASAVFIEQKYRKSGITPGQQRIALLAQYLAAKTPVNNVPVAVTTADEVAALAGYGSMAHLMAIKLFAAMGNVPALVDWIPIADGTTAKEYTVTFASNAGSSGVWRIYVSGKRYEISVASGDTPTTSAAALAALITADLSCPFSATANVGVVTFVAKWKGLSSNSLDIRKNYVASDVNVIPTTQTMVIASSVSGAGDPSIATALAGFGTTFYTWVLTGLNDSVAAGLLHTAGELRWDPVTKKPWLGVMGYIDTRANYVSAVGALNSKDVVYFPVEGSPNHPGEIAAAVVGVCAVSANTNPARPFGGIGGLTVPGILPGSSAPWTWAQENAAELAGGSVSKVVGGAVVIGDLLTTYKTNSAAAVDESFRYAVTVTNIQAKFYTIDAMLASDPFVRAIIIDDDSPFSGEYGLSPKKAKVEFMNLVDQWAESGWTKNQETVKAGIVVEINGTNAGRLDVLVPDVITAGGRIYAVKYQWGFAP